MNSLSTHIFQLLHLDFIFIHSIMKVIKASLFVPSDFDHAAFKCLCRMEV